MMAAPAPPRSPRIKHAGSPWEIGLAETHQTLVLNKLRGRIAVQVDGGMRTGRDVIIGALLGADEFGFATAPLIVEGCIMMRKCHLNTCPVGVATQDPELRKRFTGKPEHVVNFFFFVAEEVRRVHGAARLPHLQRNDRPLRLARHAQSHRSLEGERTGFLQAAASTDTGAGRGDLQLRTSGSRSRQGARSSTDRPSASPRWNTAAGAHRIAGQERQPHRRRDAVRRVAKRYGHAGLPDDTIYVKLNGTAGQSFGALLAHGITMELEGEANDYVGKGLSGGRIVIYPPTDCPIVPEENIIVGNTVLYGAITGECYFRGVAGERFAVRNSGAVAVVEGVGDHGCEYMTGGMVVVLGQAGRNFAAGMSGGIAFVLDEDGDFDQRCNMAMVELEPVPEEAAARRP